MTGDRSLNALQNGLVLWLMAAALSACSGSDRSAPPAPGSGTSSNLGTQSQTLEASGQQPKPDRSPDIKGPDTDNNGIRDDIDAWIAAQPITDPQKNAAQQMARVQQAKLVADLNDKSALQTLGERTAAAVVCMSDVFAPERQAGRDLGNQIEAITANTKERAKKYISYNRARSGSTGRLPNGNTCEP